MATLNGYLRGALMKLNPEGPFFMKSLSLIAFGMIALCSLKASAYTGEPCQDVAQQKLGTTSVRLFGKITNAIEKGRVADTAIYTFASRTPDYGSSNVQMKVTFVDIRVESNNLIGVAPKCETLGMRTLELDR